MTGNVSFDFLPGYQFLKCIQRSSLVEHWVAMAPDGHMQAVKFISGLKEDTVFPPRHLLQIASLKNIRHPRLAVVHNIVNDTGRFVIVSDWTGETVRDRIRQLREDGDEDALRAQLIIFLRDAAEGLEVLAERHGLHHLSLDPGSLLVRQAEALVTDYGLVELIWSPAGQPLAGINPRYAAPELFENRISPTSDQYSLALIYIDMISGEVPQEAHSQSQWRALHAREPAGLEKLSPEDRAILTRALDREPRNRYSSARDLFKRLAAVPPRERDLQLWLPYERRPTPVVSETTLPTATNLAAVDFDQYIQRAVKLAADTLQVRELNGSGRQVQADGSVWSSINSSRYRPSSLRCLVQSDGSLWHRCAAWLPKGMVYQKLEGLLVHWQAVVMQNTDDLLVFQLSQARNFFQKLMAGYRRDIEVEVRLLPPRIAGSQLTEVSIWIRYLGRDKEHAKQVMRAVGPNLLQELRTYLLAMPEHRDMERFPFEHRLQVAPILPNGEMADLVECLGKDISRLGIGFFAPGTPPTTLLYVRPAEPRTTDLVALIRVLRVKPIEPEGCEIAARFMIPDQDPPSTKLPVHVVEDPNLNPNHD